MEASMATFRPNRVLISCSLIACGAWAESNAVRPLIPIWWQKTAWYIIRDTRDKSHQASGHMATSRHYWLDKSVVKVVKLAFDAGSWGRGTRTSIWKFLMISDDNNMVYNRYTSRYRDANQLCHLPHHLRRRRRIIFFSFEAFDISLSSRALP